MGAQQQFQNKKVLVFDDFEGMSTQSDRHALDKNKLAWLENLQPIAHNNLLCVPAPGAVLQTIVGEVIAKQFYFNYSKGSDYVINFCESGAAYAVTNPGGVQTTIAASGTFTTSPDCTQWATERLLIADAKAGYCTWNPDNGLVIFGGVSPNIEVTAGGSGYTSAPAVAISGGAGSGATATAQITGGIVTSVTITNPGTGYGAGDTLTVTFSGGGGSGATAKAHVWPNLTPHPTTLAVFQGRVWLAATNVITYTGTGATYGGTGYDDFLSADASGSTTINDPDLIRSITALRSLNNYLFIIGDNSVKQIGTISVSGTATNFTLVTLSSDQGTPYRDTIVSYNRLVLFTNTVGVYAVFGNSVEKISDDMDGLFRSIDFSQEPCAALNDINNIHVFLLLVKYNDPNGSRSLILAFMNKKWFVISQGNTLKFITTAVISGITGTIAAHENVIVPILSDATTPVAITASTALTPDDAPYISKRTFHYAISQTVGSASGLTLTIESERQPEQIISYAVSAGIQFVNNAGDDITFTNNSGEALDFFASSGFRYTQGNTEGVAGIYLGATLIGTVASFSLNSIMIEYGLTAAWANSDVNIGMSAP